MSVSHTPSNDGITQFGPNDWMVEDLYQQYLSDPSSVDQTWRDYFSHKTPSGTLQKTPTATSAVVTQSAQITPEPITPVPTAAVQLVAPATPPAAKAPTTTASTSAPATAKASPTPVTQSPTVGSTTSALRGVAAKIATNMNESLSIPTATSVRAVPAKVLIDNRIVINNHLGRTRGGKISFTHLIGYAIVQALKSFPEMNTAYTAVGGKPALITPEHINLGLAIDLKKPDGSRSLVVASIKECENKSFTEFWKAYDEIIGRARVGKLTAADFAGTTISLTNPGTIGTVHSVPRLMSGQGAIIGVGAMEYPAEYAGMSSERLAELAVGKVMTVTSTYDHRIIQGAQSGDFLRVMHQLLLGENSFYDEIFQSIRIPYEPVRWVQDLTNISGDKNARVQQLIRSYRVRGHLMANTDPLDYRVRRHPDLDILEHGLTLWDLERTFSAGGFTGKQFMTLRQILGTLRNSYCRTVGTEYMHIQSPEERHWIQERIEAPYQKPDHDSQKHILGRLNAAEAFETFLQTKYVGQRRFSLEGGETVIPLLDEIVQAAADNDLDEVVIGMPHRGRLNVLATIVGKPYEKVFGEFEGNIDPGTAHGSGDVKYHLGATGKFIGRNDKQTIVSVTANPSHLEAVNPVLEGIVRAKQDRIDANSNHTFSVLPVLLHGDSAFAGQGVVAETINLSQLSGYRTGGTVHVVVNNQVGFTTSPESSRSSLYCTDVARMIQAPIFHVNGDDPEAAVRVAQIAFEYRQTFHKDVVIDLVCYRRRGHNEGDDPSMTQPKMYKIIDAKDSVRKLYSESLVGRGDMTPEEAAAAWADYQHRLEEVFHATKETRTQRSNHVVVNTDPDQVTTAISAEVISHIGQAHVAIPEGFTPHPRVYKVLTQRATMAAEGRIDWGFGELLAFGSLLKEGKSIRLSGQDCRRGTFVQRHSVIVDRNTEKTFTPLANLAENQGNFGVYDSLLSEFAAMGFEYGYSVENPDALVLWEAQFGDFANGGQSIVDEFISSGEIKWGQQSSVVLMLPHGHEGQGPDHTSGRIERYLQMCAQNNMIVAMPTAPANHCHLLRRHAYLSHRRPLVIFTPKSLLRLKAATSSIEDFTTKNFQAVMPDPGYDGVMIDPQAVQRVILCSGKVYYDLAAARSKQQLHNTAIIRLEQLYPLPVEEIKAALSQYPHATDHVWVQEEPSNQGAWGFVALNLIEHLDGVSLRRVSRPAAAAPATGSSKVHEDEQANVVKAALFQPTVS